VVAGLIVVLRRADVTAIRDGLLAMLLTVIGLAMVTGPWWLGMMSQLRSERRERIRTQERAELAARVHASVLQTLALIQRNADSPREVARLARGQERELRTLLYGAPATVGRFGEALRAAAAEVEDAYAVPVEVVVVGDAPVDTPLEAVCQAAREALVNAAKHSGTPSVALYAEVEPEVVTVFVRDRGTGFDPASVPQDRQGIRGSITARVERHGGSVSIRSAAPGPVPAPARFGTSGTQGGTARSGTEVEITLPRKGKTERHLVERK
jgi:signal transduction histidine kinase